MMKPITRKEIFMAAASGEFDGQLPEPLTREEYYLTKVIKRFDNIDKPTDVQVQTCRQSGTDMQVQACRQPGTDMQAVRHRRPGGRGVAKYD